jgi:hypothetical protein
MRCFGAAALAAAFLACGGGGGTNPPERATLRGTLKQSEAFAVPGQVSFAVQWMGAEYSDPILNDANRDPYAPDPELRTICSEDPPITYGTCDGTPASGRQHCDVTDVLATALLQPVRYDAAFPISFAVPVSGAPPPVALYDLSRQGGRGVYAMGTVLAFVDSNGDGALQLGTPGIAGEPGLAAAAYQDYQPADGTPRRSYFVTYLRGTIEPRSIFQGYAEVILDLPQGYGLWVKDEWVDAYGRRVSVSRHAASIDTPVELVSRPGVEESMIWCSGYDVDVTYLPALPAGEVPTTCWSGNLATDWYRDTTVAPCTLTEERYLADFTCATTTPPWSASCP